MVNIPHEEFFTIDESGRLEGALVFPGHRLVLRYERNIETVGNDETYEKGKIGKGMVSARSAPDASIQKSQICRKLISALGEIPEMDQVDVRGNLVRTGFDPPEVSLILKARSNDIYVDLSHIVNFVMKLEKIDQLIENALLRPQSKRTKKKLESILDEYQRLDEYHDLNNTPTNQTRFQRFEEPQRTEI